MLLSNASHTPAAALTWLSAGNTMLSYGPVIALANLLKMMGSSGIGTFCSRQWSR